jgi:hypothetical protein
MSSHLFMGAINKLSNDRETPLFADKKNNYMCPDCNKDVIFKKGKIKKAHFAHKASEIKCTFYDKPSETQIHKEAKILMKSLLNNKKELHFYRKCSDCDKHKNIDIHYNDNMKAIIEYKFKYNDSNKSADVALVEDNNIKYIFEICYKSKTKECNRPEPWVEIDAEELIKNINENNDYNIECIREYICDECIETKITDKTLQEQKTQERILRKKHKLENKILGEQMGVCLCDIKKKDLCNCLEPNFELCELREQYYCKKCNLWKCKCNNIIDDKNNTEILEKSKILEDSESDDEGRLFNYKVDYYSKGKCYGCGKNTHHFKDCHLKNIPKCDKCKNYGHRRINCIKDTYSNTTCYKCNKFGHMSKNCLYKNFFNGCYKCGQADHLTKKCSNKTENINDKNKYPKQNLINNVDFVD